jgi:hypothetical protein
VGRVRRGMVSDVVVGLGSRWGEYDFVTVIGFAA